MSEVIDRRTFVGGSDVAAILGISPWSSPWSVWAEKTGLVEASHSDEQTERMQIGTDAEQFLGEVFNRHHADQDIKLIVGQTDYYDERWPWLRAHADGAIVDRDTHCLLHGWEAKTSGDLKPWDEIPAMYQAQAQTYMMLSGLDEWWFTVGFAGWKVRHYTVKADPDDQALIAARTAEFWEMVQSGTPPDTDGSDATTAALAAAYGHSEGDDALTADTQMLADVERLRYWRSEAKEVDRNVAELENKIKAFLAEGTVLVDAAGVPLVTWKASTSHRVDLNALKADHPDLCEKYTTANTTRRFLVKTPKGDQ